MPAAQAQGITASGGWFRYLLAQIPAGGFVTLRNTTARPVELTGVQSPSCGMALLHRSLDRGGVERMRMMKSVSIPAKSAFRFSPGGYHIMCMQPRMAPGQIVMVRFLFGPDASLAVPFKVYGAAGRPEKH